jgi:hypothetical protein
MNQRSLFVLAGFAALLVSACGGGGSSRNSSGVSGFTIIEVSNGFGKLLPHRIPIKDAAGLPTSNVIEITTYADLANNVTLTNPILPPVQWKPTAELPNAEPGNHFIYAHFSAPLLVDSILSSAPASGSPNNLTGNIQVVTVDPMSGNTVPIAGRGFVGGRTYGTFTNGSLQLEPWVSLDATGKPVANTLGTAQPGLGFPGTEGAGFAGANLLVDDSTLVFVVDADSNLATHEMFPGGFQIQIKITQGVRSSSGRPLGVEGVASSTVGPDTIPPEVLVAGAALTPVIVPGNGEIDVDPQTKIEVFFTEPVQILRVGRLDDGTVPALSAAIQLQFGPSTGKVSVPFFVEPLSIFDLTHLALRPVYAFPGSGPANLQSCGDLSQIDVIVNRSQIADLASTATPNLNTLSPSTFFLTGEGPGIVNAPVTPDSVYVGRGGSNQGISVVDLNGFGLGTGNPTYDITRPILKGNSNAPNNPNLQLQGALMIPPIQQGTCTTNGGSEGVFSLAKDSSLDDMLARAPILESVGDMAIGHSLDSSFNNGTPFGCQSGGGNICAWTGLKLVTIATGGASTLVPGTTNAQVFPIKTEFGVENLVSWAPHPNPPPLTFPPLCLSPVIGAQEPTSVCVILPLPPLGPPCGLGLTNQLVPGDPYGDPLRGIPPTGLLSREQNGFFQGPAPPQQSIANCQPFMMRQQVGQFLYVVDRAAGEIVVLNSNRFTVIDRITLPDPTSLAMSPNLDLLAVTNQRADQVSFIDINPNSFLFHTVVKTVVVGRGPIGLAWTPDNEDILVVNQRDNTMSIISAFTLDVRKVVRNQLRSPFEVCITPRQNGFAFLRGVYYAYVLNGDGTVAIFESGPDGINGWGFDDLIGTIPFTFQNPKTISVDLATLNSQFWVVHENQLDLATGQPNGRPGGAVTSCGIKSAISGQILIDTNLLGRPQIRDIEYGLFASIGSDQLTGVPTDIAFDNMQNRTGLTNISNPFSASTPLSINGKAVVKGGGGAATAFSPQFMFLAVPNSLEGPGVVDVIDLRSGLKRVDTDRFTPGIQSIPAPNARTVVDFSRQ